MIDAYPLAWPAGRPRTKYRERSRFDVSFARARDDVVREIDRLGGGSFVSSTRNVVISTNVPVRRDGLPYANQREPEDPAVAVYFTYFKRPMCFACDQWDRVKDNLRAIAKTIEALRGIARWGTGDMLERAFTGFEALPAPAAEQPWWAVLGLDDPKLMRHTSESIERRFRALAATHHPDKGGDAEQFKRLVKARDEARKVVA